MTENEITYAIRGAAFEVHTAFGPGLFESLYEAALAAKLRQQGLDVMTQVSLPVDYAGVRLEAGYRVDMLVNRRVIVELKSTDGITDLFRKQLLTYLRLSGCKVGLLINFNVSHLRDGIERIVNNL
jgi:GxxExxY protein